MCFHVCFYSLSSSSSSSPPTDRQPQVQTCSCSGVMISTSRSQGEASRKLLLPPNIHKYLPSWFKPLFLSSQWFSLTHIELLALALSHTRAHSKCSWNVWCGLNVAQASPAPFSSKSLRFRICFYSPLCQGPNSKLTRKNLSLTRHVFPGGRNVKQCAWMSWVIIIIWVLICLCLCSHSKRPSDLTLSLVSVWLLMRDCETWLQADEVSPFLN